MVRPVFAAFVLLALLGDARIFLFVMNRVVFGSHREEKSRWHWLMYAVPPLLLVLTALFWPLSRWIDQLLATTLRLDEITWSIALAKMGATWLIIAAAVGSYWILERIRLNYLPPPPVAGVRELPSVRRGRARSLNQIYDLEVTRHDVFIEDLPPSFDGYRIAFLTDTHVASFVRRDYHREIVEQVRAFDPDLILFGGDFVTWGRHIAILGERLLAGLSARDGMFAILGNHDYWAGAGEVTAALAAHGVQMITNRSVMLARGTGRLPLIGIDEMYRGKPDVDRAFGGIAPSGPCIGISHHPDIIDLLGGRRLDLLLCGHTHGGQIRFPFFGAVVVPSLHETEFAAGFHRVGAVLMYVSRGLGAIPPLRILCRPEVATFVLQRDDRKTL